METSRLKLGELREHPIVRAILSQAKYRNKDSQFNENNHIYEGGQGKFVFKDKTCKVCSSTFKPKAKTQNTCSYECRVDYDVVTKFSGYGMTVFDYVEIWEAQNGKCAICRGDGFLMHISGHLRGKSKSVRDSKHVLPLVVDHCHSTGKVRGLLCHNCNRALGLLKDSEENLLRAITYLEGATTIPKGSTLKRVEVPSSSKEDDDIV
jgi:hypothetical protein